MFSLNKKAAALAVLLSAVLLGNLALLVAADQTPAPTVLRLSTTTSVEQSGLLAELTKAFTKKTNIEVHVVAVGTGAALNLARKGDADATFVHSPDLEKQFMDEGFGSSHVVVCFSEFVIVGPAEDPAGIKSAKKPEEALTRIANKNAEFISRGDNSGTHVFELGIWKKAGITPKGSWYVEAGRGMSETIIMATERSSYTITDVPTWLATVKTSWYVEKYAKQLGVLYKNAELMNNRYSFIVVSKTKIPTVNDKAAVLFSDFLVSKEGQDIIRNYKINGENCFLGKDGK